MREDGDQAKMACDNLQLRAGLEDGIEGETHAVGQQRHDRESQIRRKEEVRIPGVVEDEDKEAGSERLTVETEVTEEEAAEILKA